MAENRVLDLTTEVTTVTFTDTAPEAITVYMDAEVPVRLVGTIGTVGTPPPDPSFGDAATLGVGEVAPAIAGDLMLTPPPIDRTVLDRRIVVKLRASGAVNVLVEAR